MELKGSRTEKNLEIAFAGESQARNKYTYLLIIFPGNESLPKTKSDSLPMCPASVSPVFRYSSWGLY